jgi:hypothetical protein
MNMEYRITRSENSFTPTQEMASCLSRVRKHLAGGNASTVTLPSRLPEKGFGDVEALDLCIGFCPLGTCFMRAARAETATFLQSVWSLGLLLL